MAVKVKTEEEIKIMREAGTILAEISEQIYEKVVPGISTDEIDQFAFALCKKYDVEPAFKGYGGFPATICVGVDDIAIHGIPATNEILEEGQTISVDMGIKYKGYYSDMASTLAVGKIDDDGERLLDITKLALNAAISKAVEGNTIGDIGHAMYTTANMAGFSVILDMVGHGIGKELHEEPQVPCIGTPGNGILLKENMILAIEAMINEGDSDLIFEDDGWTTRTKDGKRSAIFEHTVRVGKKTAEILTIK